MRNTRFRSRTGRSALAALAFLAWVLVCPTSGTVVHAAGEGDAGGSYRYTLGGRVRLLLFWVGRDQVGVGRFVRREGHDGRIVELMVGMEPERAPRRANRWGFTREVLRGTETDVVVAGTDYEAESVEDVKARLQRDVPIAVGVLRSRITSDAVVVRTTALETDHQTTYRDIDTILTRATDDGDGNHWRTRRVARPEGVRPGFLMTLAEWIDRTVEAYAHDPGSVSSQVGGSIPYVYSDRLYDMTLRRLTFEPEARFKDRTYPNVLHAQFEARNRRTGERNRFAVSYGTGGDLAGVPVRIVLKPRWWLEAELLLDR